MVTFSTVFTAYVIIVAAGVAIAARIYLTRRGSLMMVASLMLWLVYAAVLGVTGVAGRHDQVPPGIALLTAPIAITLLAVTLTRPGAIIARHIPLGLLLGFQLFRLGVELTLHHLWSIGLAPRIMTLGGGNIEILVAATAPAAAWLACRGSMGRKVAWAWNLIGLFSLANIVVRAVLSAPGPLHLIVTETPDVGILIYPFTFVPGFMAPLAMALHILAFRSFHAHSGRVQDTTAAPPRNDGTRTTASLPSNFSLDPRTPGNIVPDS
jgi:hypothetical protein